jgi:outer membrane receptor protein involved in Fe transport
VSFTDGRLPRLVDQAPHNSTDPFALTQIELVRTRFIDRERSLRFDLSRSDQLDFSHDLYVDAQLQVDMNVRYSLSKHLSLAFDALNLNDSPYYVFTGRPGHNEQYGRSYRLNLVYSLD